MGRMDSEGAKPPPIVEREIPYRMRWTILVFLLTLFPLFTAGAAWMVLTWDGEVMSVNGISFGQSGTQIFNWFGLLMFGGCTLLSLYLLYRRLTDQPRLLIIRNDAIVIPPGFRRPLPTVIPYADITAVESGNYEGRESLAIRVGKKRYSIDPEKMPSKSEFYEVLRILQARRP
jgi:hypothetical protein